jgi:MerR family transcriptional regulator, redox-sensitive transcriptional activator SoxR
VVERREAGGKDAGLRGVEVIYLQADVVERHTFIKVTSRENTVLVAIFWWGVKGDIVGFATDMDGVAATCRRALPANVPAEDVDQLLRSDVIVCDGNVDVFEFGWGHSGTPFLLTSVQPQPKLRSSYYVKAKAVNSEDVISIGDLAVRTGVSVSAIRFYEGKGMITPFRSSGGQRRFLRSDIRRISFIRIAQNLGLSIEEIGTHLAALPQARTPLARNWEAIGKALADRLDAQIATLSRMRETLDGCIGCGCLSLKKCALYNPGDRAGKSGAGARFVLGIEA